MLLLQLKYKYIIPIAHKNTNDYHLHFTKTYTTLDYYEKGNVPMIDMRA